MKAVHPEIINVENLKSDFKAVFNDHIGCANNFEYKIRLLPQAIPVAHKVRPYH